MQKHLMSSKQAICILILFTLGSSLVTGVNTDAKQDSWITILIALLMFLPLMLAYARIVNLYPGQDFYTIAIDVFGKVAGKIVVFLYVLYSIHLGALVMRNFSEFIEIVTMPETPQFILLLFMLGLCVWMSKSGVETLGSWAKFAVPVVVFAILITTFMSLSFMNFSNIRPVVGIDFGTLMGSSFATFSFPFAETVLFSALFCAVEPNGNPFKIYIVGTGVAAAALLTVVLRNILVLGVPTMTMYFFPSYSSNGVISLGDFFTRLEVLSGMVFMIAGFVKISVCMFSASMGISKIINIQNSKNVAVPVGLLMMTLAETIYKNTGEMFNWLNVYKYYAIPFQIVLPLAVLAGAEIKTRIRKLTAAQSAGQQQ